MGQKVNPHGARVGVIKDWSTRWYADKKNFADNLVSDAKLRKMIKNLEFTDDKSKKTVKLYDNDNTQTAIACDPIVEYMSIEQLKKSIERTRKQMESAAEKMEFIEAAQYRDEMFKLMEILKRKGEN